MLTDAIFVYRRFENAYNIKKSWRIYRQLCKDRNNGKILTPDGLRLICEAYKNDPEAIGKHILETLARIQNKERY